MLTISKPLSAGQAQTYHQKEFTATEQNYWSQRGVITGEWQGRLAAQFGLTGNVSAEDFAKLSQGQHPQTGEQLVRQRASYEYQDADGKTVTTMEHRAGLWMLALTEFREVLGGDGPGKAELRGQAPLPFACDDAALRPIVLLLCSEFLLVVGLRLACGKRF